MDTDSCYYFTTRLLPNRIPLGPLVGEWSDEGVGYRRALRAKTGDPTADSTITNFKCLATKSCMKVMAPTRRDYWGDGEKQMQPAEKMALKVGGARARVLARSNYRTCRASRATATTATSTSTRSRGWASKRTSTA
jgi:hypothetical protein